MFHAEIEQAISGADRQALIIASRNTSAGSAPILGLTTADGEDDCSWPIAADPACPLHVGYREERTFIGRVQIRSPKSIAPRKIMPPAILAFCRRQDSRYPLPPQHMSARRLPCRICRYRQWQLTTGRRTHPQDRRRPGKIDACGRGSKRQKSRLWKSARSSRAARCAGVS